MRKRRWTEIQFRIAVESSTSIRQVIKKLGLKPAGGNYFQISKYLQELKINVNNFKGKGWSKGMKGIGKPRLQLNQILINDSDFQSFKLKKRLFEAKLKFPKCELCNWSEKASDGRIPLELDHINGNSRDNRLENLRVLCPNCHSLQSTHRGKNKKARW